MIVRFTGFVHTAVYSSAAVQDWRAGECRDVPAEEAARLTATFPEAFVVVQSEPAPEAPKSRKKKE